MAIDWADPVAIVSNGVAYTVAAASCDYPTVGNVRQGVVYSSGALTGTLLVEQIGPGKADVIDITPSDDSLRLIATLQSDGSYILAPPSNLVNTVDAQTTYTKRRKITLAATWLSGKPTQTLFCLVLDTNNFDFTAAQADGTDIHFSMDATPEASTDYLEFERQHYDNAAELGIFWIKLPTLEATTELYMFYGQSPVTDREATTDAWSRYKSVIHGDLSSTKQTKSFVSRFFEMEWGLDFQQILLHARVPLLSSPSQVRQSWGTPEWWTDGETVNFTSGGSATLNLITGPLYGRAENLDEIDNSTAKIPDASLDPTIALSNLSGTIAVSDTMTGATSTMTATFDGWDEQYMKAIDCTGMSDTNSKVIMELLSAKSPYTLGGGHVYLNSTGVFDGTNRYDSDDVGELGIRPKWEMHEITFESGDEEGTVDESALTFFRLDLDDRIARSGLMMRNGRVEFDTGAGGNTLLDVTGNQYDIELTDESELTDATGILHKARQFQGTGFANSFRCVSLMDIEDSSWTFSAWFRPETGSTDWYLFGITTNFCRLVIDQTNNEVRWEWGDRKVFSVSKTFTMDAWHHVSLVRDKLKSEWRLYIDGSETVHQDIGVRDINVLSGLNRWIYIGSDNTLTSAEKFQGRICEVFWAMRAMDADEIQTLYNTVNSTGVTVAAEESGAAVTKPYGLALSLDDGGTLYVSHTPIN